MAELVGNHICLREFPGSAEFLAELIEEAQVDVHPFVFGTVERSSSRLGSAASGLRVVAEQHQLGMTVTFQLLLPCLLHVVEHKRDELYFFVLAFGGAGIPICVPRVLTRRGGSAAAAREQILFKDKAE